MLGLKEKTIIVVLTTYHPSLVPGLGGYLKRTSKTRKFFIFVSRLITRNTNSDCYNFRAAVRFCTLSTGGERVYVKGDQFDLMY